MTGTPTLLVTPAADALVECIFHIGGPFKPEGHLWPRELWLSISRVSPHVVFLPSLLHWLTGHVGKILYQMLVIQAFRADHLLAMASRFVAMVMGDSFQHFAEQELDMATIVNKEVRSEERRVG